MRLHTRMRRRSSRAWSQKWRTRSFCLSSARNPNIREINMKAFLLQTPRLLALTIIIGVSSADAQVTNRLLSPFSVNVNDIAGTQEPFIVFNTQAPSVRYQQVYQNSD